MKKDDLKETATLEVTESNEQVFIISEGQTCRIDFGTHGMNVNGPAKIILINTN